MGGRLGRLIWTRRYSFQSVHSLNVGAVTEHQHGHQYFLEVSFSGRDIDTVDRIVRESILESLHARELTAINPSTGECIADWIHERLNTTAIAPRLTGVALQETRKNRFVSARTEAKYV